MNVRSKIISGLGWTTFANVGGQVLGLVTTMILARILVPADFGMVAMVLVFTHFATMLADFGMASAIVQRQKIEQGQLHTIFWLNLLLGLVLLGVGILGAQLVATFYEEPRLVEITWGLSVCFVLSAVGLVPSALIRKEMRFKLHSLITVAALIISSVAALIAAFWGLGAWSLVVQAIVRALSASILYLAFGRYRPGLAFRLQETMPLIRYGLGYTGFHVVNFWAKNIDNLLIGKILGAQTLGYYTQAYSLMRLPITQVMGSLTGVMFPALASIQDDREEVKTIYLKTASFMALAVFPISVAMFVMAEAIVLTFLGDQWEETIVLLQILAVTGISSTFSNPTGWIYTSQGRTDWLFLWGLFASGLLIVGISIGALIGSAQAIALGYAIVHVPLSYPAVTIPGRLINLRFSEVARVSAGPLMCALLMGAAILTVDFVLPVLPVGLQFIALLITGLLVYGGLVFGLKLAPGQEMLEFLRRSRQSPQTLPADEEK